MVADLKTRLGRDVCSLTALKKAAVVFYSFGGTTRRLAEKTADARGAELIEIREIKKRSVAGAFFKGCFAALRGKRSEIQPPDTELAGYEEIVLMGPVWAGKACPAFNSMIALLPPKKKVSVILTSGSGKDSAEAGIRAAIAQQGCEVFKYKNIESQSF